VRSIETARRRRCLRLAARNFAGVFTIRPVHNPLGALRLSRRLRRGLRPPAVGERAAATGVRRRVSRLHRSVRREPASVSNWRFRG
jgi:hypothetical protein